MPRIKKHRKSGKTVNRPQSWFERNPKKTLFTFVLVMIVTFDLLAGRLFIPTDYHSFRTPHPVYHHGFYPNMKTFTKWGDRVYPMATNSMALIDRSPREIPLHKGKKRIVLLGDSFTEGVGVSYEESFSGKLQALLQNQGVEVLNAGTVSYSPKLYYLRMKYLIEQKKLQFDELIVLIDISDIQDEILYQSFNPGEENIYSVGCKKIHKKFTAVSFLYFSLFDILKRIKKRSKAFEDDTRWADINVWKAQLNPELMESIGYYKIRGLWTIDSSIFKQWGKRGLEMATRNMSKLVALCKMNHINITIAVYPWPEQIHYNDLNSIQVRHWENFANKHQTGFINLFPVFITGEDPRIVYKKYFIFGDEHWNDRGHTLVAGALYTYLKSRDAKPLKPSQTYLKFPSTLNQH